MTDEDDGDDELGPFGSMAIGAVLLVIGLWLFSNGSGWCVTLRGLGGCIIGGTLFGMIMTGFGGLLLLGGYLEWQEEREERAGGYPPQQGAGQPPGPPNQGPGQQAPPNQAGGQHAPQTHAGGQRAPPNQQHGQHGGRGGGQQPQQGRPTQGQQSGHGGQQHPPNRQSGQQGRRPTQGGQGGGPPNQQPGSQQGPQQQPTGGQSGGQSGQQGADQPGGQRNNGTDAADSQRDVDDSNRGEGSE